MTSTVADGTVTSGREITAQDLAGEHFGLLRDVQRRADAVVALLDVRVWPHAELNTLIGFLRSTVLRQASDEEVLIFPNDSSGGPFAELSADHARLYGLTARLERVHAEPCPLDELRVLLEELIAALRRHLVAEHEIFEALASVDGAPSDAENEPLIIRMDALPDQVAVRMCIERVLRLAPGRRAEIRARDHDHLRAVTEWLQGFDARRFGLAPRPADDDGEALLEVSCRVPENW